MDDRQSAQELEASQLQVCAKYGVVPRAPAADSKVGIALNVRSGLLPINGMRIAPERGTCGWYIWAGDQLSDAEDFFVPLHVVHLAQWSRLPLPFVLLPPGWRFLTDGEHVDVWFDPRLPDA